MNYSNFDPFLFPYGNFGFSSTDHEKEKTGGSDFFPSSFFWDSDVISAEDEKMKWCNYQPDLLDYNSDLVGSGLNNIGNNCYLNSVLQCMIHTVPLVEKLRSSDHHHYLNGNDSDFCSHCAFTKLAGLCMDRSGSAVTPFDFVNNLSKISSDFWPGMQQDAHEFLTCFLNNLHSCCLDPSSRDHPSSVDQDSIVKHVFGGRLTSQLSCCECGHCSNKPEPLLNISLGIDDIDTLTNALESFTKAEQIEEVKFSCEGCKSKVLMEKQLKIEQAPEVVSFHLKRFRNSGLDTDKIDKFIEYPLELDLRPFMICPHDEEQTIYDLYAVLVHEGDASYGHYYCFIRSSPSTWHLLNDSKVHRVTEMNALKQMAYMLFYIKKGSSPWFSSLMDAQGSSPDSSNWFSCLMDSQDSSNWFCGFPGDQIIQMDTSPPAVLRGTERTNSERLAINFLDVFNDEAIETLDSWLEQMDREEDEKDLTGAMLGGSDVPSLPTIEEKHGSKRSPLISKPRPINNKKRRAV